MKRGLVFAFVKLVFARLARSGMMRLFRVRFTNGSASGKWTAHAPRRLPFGTRTLSLCSALSLAVRAAVSILLVLACVVACTRPADEKYLATSRQPAKSPSGKYLLRVSLERDPISRYYTFDIEDAVSGRTLFKSVDRFQARHTTYFLWDVQDRVWVYSGDIGTSYWANSASNTWERFDYTKEVTVPPYLARKRPEFFR